MSLTTLEKEGNVQLTDFKKLLSENIQQGKMFAVFQLLMKTTRELSEQDDEDFRSEFIVDLMEFLKDVCNSVLKCRNCCTNFQFRHCRNPRDNQNDIIHVIELTCEGCGDCFTFAEDRTSVSYFNFNVLKKVDNLRRRGRGLTIKVTLGGQIIPALLIVKDHSERSVVWIDAYQVFNAEDVQLYWERAKAIIKREKLISSNEKSCIQVEDGIFVL